MKYLLLVSIYLGWGVCQGQKDDLWRDLKNKFPDEAAVYVDRSEILTIQVEGDSLSVFKDVFEKLLHLKEQTESFSSKKVYGSHFSQVQDIKAKTLVWENDKYKSVAVSGFKKNSDRDRGIFFDDSYFYSFDFPLVAAHNLTQLEYREIQKDARFISGYVFSSYLPQAHTSFTIKTTKDVDIFFQVLNDPDHNIQFKKTEKGKNVVYEWTGENLPSIKYEEKSPSLRYYAPHVVCYVKSYQTRTKKVDVISNIESLYKWYQTFIKDVNLESSSELKGVVEKLKGESKTEMDLVRAIFYWVQDNIQYIAFEQGMRGLIPNSGSYTCEKRYGDCKDMANLLVNMLQLGGVKAYHTWIGSRELPYRYSELPSPLVDNHMIATYISPEGKYYFLDATSDYTPVDFPSSMIQGKEALIAISPTTFEIKEVPILDKERSVMYDSIAIQLMDSQIIGTGKCSLTGYTKVFGGYELDRAEESTVKRNLTELVRKGSNKFMLEKYEMKGIQNQETPTQITYDFKLQDYVQKAGDELYVNLNLNKDYYNSYINLETRKTPKEADYKYVEYNYVEMKIPSGYKVQFLPENASYSGKIIGFEIKYKVEGDRILLSKKMDVNYLLLYPDQFQDWNEGVKNLSKAYRESIILKKK